MMPEISRFLGIVIRMFPSEHNPPHIHAVYNDFEAQFSNEVFLKKIFKKKHPHACGEYPAMLARIETTEETPPRVWGILNNFQHCFGFIRNTPTRVGNTIPVQSFPVKF